MAERGREDVKRKLLSFSQDCKGKRNQFMNFTDIDLLLLCNYHYYYVL